MNKKICIVICFVLNLSNLFANIDSMHIVSDTLYYQNDSIQIGNDSVFRTVDSTSILNIEYQSEKKDTITIIGVGDIMLGTTYPSDGNYLPPNNDCMPLLSDVKHILRSADVTFGNLEGVLTDSHAEGKNCNDPKNCYSFAMPTKYVDCLVDAGFNVMSIANNHVGDFGNQGRVSTMKMLDSAGINYAGLLIKDRAIFTIDGITYGFCAFAPNSGTSNFLDIPLAQKLVKELADVCDIVIVSHHGGAEGAKYERTPRTRETFLNLDRGEVYKFSHAVIDAGADVVFGHGPHVTRAMDIYKDRFIIYSLGNFCTYRRFNLSGPNGIAPIIKVYTDNTGKFIKGHITPIDQYAREGTKIDPQARVIKKLQELTKLDFPEVPLVIEDTGWFYLDKSAE